MAEIPALKKPVEGQGSWPFPLFRLGDIHPKWVVGMWDLLFHQWWFFQENLKGNRVTGMPGLLPGNKALIRSK